MRIQVKLVPIGKKFLPLDFTVTDPEINGILKFPYCQRIRVIP